MASPVSRWTHRLRVAVQTCLSVNDRSSLLPVPLSVVASCSFWTKQRQPLVSLYYLRREYRLTVEADYETDSVIQSSLRTELGKDVTLLTVAHRLQTIMDADKIVSGGFIA